MHGPPSALRARIKLATFDGGHESASGKIIITGDDDGLDGAASGKVEVDSIDANSPAALNA